MTTLLQEYEHRVLTFDEILKDVNQNVREKFKWKYDLSIITDPDIELVHDYLYFNQDYNPEVLKSLLGKFLTGSYFKHPDIWKRYTFGQESYISLQVFTLILEFNKEIYGPYYKSYLRKRVAFWQNKIKYTYTYNSDDFDKPIEVQGFLFKETIKTIRIQIHNR